MHKRWTKCFVNHYRRHKTCKLERKTNSREVKNSFNTKRVLFVLAGAFSELILHTSTHSKERSYITDEDLIRFGLKRELINRVRTIVRVKPFKKKNF